MQTAPAQVDCRIRVDAQQEGWPSGMTSESVQSVSGCPICGKRDFEDVGVVHGTVIDREFELRRCRSCQFVMVANPSLEFDVLYSEDYYNGRGADTKLNYAEEVQHPTRAVRRYEWRGVLERVRDLTSLAAGSRWLDYGCGTG